MNIAIIGAGFTGLSAAFSLQKKGHTVTVFERDENPGGLALGFTEPKWEWTLEKHYHHWFTNDSSVLNLAKELQYPVVIKRPKTSVFLEGSMYQLDSPISVFTFPLLSFIERIRMAAVIGILRYNPFWKPLEKIQAANFLKIAMGKNPYEKIWEPQLVNKFGSFVPEISLAWFWARITKRTPSLAYPEKGFLAFGQFLSSRIISQKGTIHYETETTRLEENKDKTITITIKDLKNKKIRKETFDKVIVTIPSFLFLQIAPSLPTSYKNSLKPLKGLGAINLVLRLKEKFFTDNTYWLSICEKNAPVMAVVEHTNFMDKKHYNNERLLYVGNYLPANHRYFSFTKEQLLKEYDPLLKKLNNEYKKQIIGIEAFKVPFAQPIIPLNYSKMMPPFETPFTNVYLANIQQVYPWDRGTNYAVELGEKVVDLMTS